LKIQLNILSELHIDCDIICQKIETENIYIIPDRFFTLDFDFNKFLFSRYKHFIDLLLIKMRQFKYSSNLTTKHLDQLLKGIVVLDPNSQNMLGVDNNKIDKHLVLLAFYLLILKISTSALIYV